MIAQRPRLIAETAVILTAAFDGGHPEFERAEAAFELGRLSPTQGDLALALEFLLSSAESALADGLPDISRTLHIAADVVGNVLMDGTAGTVH
jgi:hypothetical protein